MKKKVNITFDDVLEALELGTSDISQYLNTETGGIAMVSEMGDAFDEDGESLDYDEREKFQDEKYLALPTVDSHDGFRDMEDFIRTVKNAGLRNRLDNAVNQRRPFRKFKDALIGSPEEQRWFKFQTERNRERAKRWLEDNNIEPVGKP